MAEIIFWFLFILLIYVQIGYLLVLKISNFFCYRNEEAKEVEDKNLPPVSIIMLAFNEEDRISKWFQNIAQLDYPKEKLEIIVASDGSTDRTVQELMRFKSDNVLIMDFKNNRGRALCHNDTVAAAKNEIIITTDVDSEFSPQTVNRLVRHFRSPKVGAIIGRLQYRKKDDSTSSFESIYLKFESAIKAEESKLGILSVGMGCCSCIKKSLFVNLGAKQDIDNVYPLFAVKKGYRIVYEPTALVTDTSPSSVSSEFHARIRIASRSFRDNIKSWNIKDCIKHPLITWGIFSHRILRWMTPFLLAGLLLSNIFLLNYGDFYSSFFGLQVLAYFAVILGGIADYFKKNIPIASHAYVFFIANVGIAIGVLKAFFGKPPSSYIPTK